MPCAHFPVTSIIQSKPVYGCLNSPLLVIRQLWVRKNSAANRFEMKPAILYLKWIEDIVEFPFAAVHPGTGKPVITPLVGQIRPLGYCDEMVDRTATCNPLKKTARYAQQPS